MQVDGMDWLVFDFGVNYGDNFRGFLFLKALKRKFPEIRMTCWITPALDRGLGGLRKFLAFLDRFLIRERSPKETYLLNFSILKRLLEENRKFSLENFPAGCGPDGNHYDKIIPNAEPWITAKWIRREALEAPDSVNQGEFLQEILNLSTEELNQAMPLFGRREKVDDLIAVGLCRPRERDRKQPSRKKIDQVWEILLKWPGRIAVLDFQEWYPPPRSPKIEDHRKKSWVEKVPLLNRASLFVGIDGGLNHFAAACGCPTLSFFGERHGTDWGEKVGPYPRETPFGEHLTVSNFDAFLLAADRRLKQLAKSKFLSSIPGSGRGIEPSIPWIFDSSLFSEVNP
jgi:hypothetical protein